MSIIAWIETGELPFRSVESVRRKAVECAFSASMNLFAVISQDSAWAISVFSKHFTVGAPAIILTVPVCAESRHPGMRKALYGTKMFSGKMIIWDWNGTLLDDIDACVRSINMLLEKRRMQTIDRERYRNEFYFPVIDYYRAMGFDLERERFEVLAEEYVKTYQAVAADARLQEGAVEMLRLFEAKGCRQIILSAMETTALKMQVESRGILRHFDEILGSDDIHAHGKIRTARDYLQKQGIPADRVMIGDTYHDHEVAEALDCPCVLVSNGHQNLARFAFNHRTRIAGSLLDLIPEHIFRNGNGQ